MARRRSEGVYPDDEPLPAELLGPEARNARRDWFAARQMYTWQDQHDTLQRAYAAAGLDRNGRDPNAPDPRRLLEDPNYGRSTS